MFTPTVADRVLVGLEDPAAQDPEEVGHKAATLAQLQSKGFSVPSGVVLTRSACERILAAAGLSSGATVSLDCSVNAAAATPKRTASSVGMSFSTAKIVAAVKASPAPLGSTMSTRIAGTNPLASEVAYAEP